MPTAARPGPEPPVRDWLARWEASILEAARARPCDTARGEQVGWLVSPFLEGFYHGYLATGDLAWLDRLVDWAEAWIRRAARAPDGFRGWPAPDGGRGVPFRVADSLLGEAMALAPLVRFAGAVLGPTAPGPGEGEPAAPGRQAGLRDRYGARAEAYLALAEETFRKWDARGAWRETREGGVWVVPPCGLDPATGRWTAGDAGRDGFTEPFNKQNLIARWLLALADATGEARYRERAAAWWRWMRARMRPRQDRYLVWAYWEPAGAWDYRPDGSTKHWVGVHPNGGYYALDVAGVVDAHEHGLVFTREDLDRLVATNRDYMWTGQGARFRRIDGGPPDPRWRDRPGVLWTALVPYDATLRRLFEAHHDPGSWGGLALTPRYLVGGGGDRWAC